MELNPCSAASENMALYDYIVVGASSADIALARWFPRRLEMELHSSMFCRSRNMALYDYTVVGAGSAGVAVAGWLANSGM
jgi:hypothetical protein